METKITTSNSQVTIKEGQIIIDTNGLNKENVIREISKYQQEMIKEINKLDQTADKDRLLANLIRGHINASSNIMKIVSEL